MTDDAAVDPLSLFLSLGDEHDERVQAELETMPEIFSRRGDAAGNTSIATACGHRVEHA